MPRNTQKNQKKYVMGLASKNFLSCDIEPNFDKKNCEMTKKWSHQCVKCNIAPCICPLKLWRKKLTWKKAEILLKKKNIFHALQEVPSNEHWCDTLSTNNVIETVQSKEVYEGLMHKKSHQFLAKQNKLFQRRKTLRSC